MTYLVAVSFDIKNGDSDDYATVYAGLKKLSLLPTVEGSNKTVKLPTTMVIGEVEGTTVAGVRDTIRTKVAGIYETAKLKGEIFVIAAEAAKSTWGSQVV